jgi:hypothetical protein
MGWFGPNMGDYTFEMIRHLSDAMSQPNPKGGSFSSEN